MKMPVPMRCGYCHRIQAIYFGWGGPSNFGGTRLWIVPWSTHGHGTPGHGLSK